MSADEIHLYLMRNDPVYRFKHDQRRDMLLYGETFHTEDDNGIKTRIAPERVTPDKEGK